MRPALHYGVRHCPGCYKTADAGLELDVTGQTQRMKPPFMQGRKILQKGGAKGEPKDLGPRFDASHERDYAELRCPLCGRTWWSPGPQAVADAKATQAGLPLPTRAAVGRAEKTLVASLKRGIQSRKKAAQKRRT